MYRYEQECNRYLPCGIVIPKFDLVNSSVDSDEMPHIAAFIHGLHCLLR